MDELKVKITKIVADLLQEEKADNTLLALFVNKAVDEFIAYVNYPQSFEYSIIEDEIEKYKYCIADLAIFDYEKQGINSESVHIESGVTSHYSNKGAIYTKYRVVPYATL